MESEKILEERVCNVDGRNSKFIITRDENTLDIDYKRSEIEHGMELERNGAPLLFRASPLARKYIEKAEILADEFCRKYKLKIDNLVSSYPVYRVTTSII